MRKNIITLALNCFCAIAAFAQDAINDLSNIELQKMSYLQANYARDGSNLDGTNTSNFLDTIPRGLVNNPNGVALPGFEYVIAHIEGPAVLERIWNADVKNNDALLRFYFDGESTPRFSATFAELFYQKTSVFDHILVKNVFESSGGNTLYASLLIKDNLIITSESNMYSQVNFSILPKDTLITSWDNSNDDYQTDLFAKSGTYPKSNLAELKTKNVSQSIQPQQKIELFKSNQPGTIEGIRLDISDLNFDYAERIYDEGNVRKGVANFRMNIDGKADSLFLVNRMNKNSILGRVKSSSARVLVDNQFVGNWLIDDYREYHFWEDEKFYIPKSFYEGKENIKITVQYQTGDPWNEFRYQTVCNNIVIDELDIKNTISQNNHQYTVTGLQNNLINEFTSKATARYRTPIDVKQKNQRILDSVYISVYYDDATTPAIHAPIGLFFGAGTNDAAYMEALLMGNYQKTYYNYMTMPYWENIKIELTNFSSLSIDSIFGTTLYTQNVVDKNTHGYLNASVIKETKSPNDPTDFNFLKASGKGKMIAHVMQGIQDTVITGPNSYLEGDERIYIDDAKTPFLYGTGTEDIFNGGFYFVLDEFCLPLGGMSNSDVKQNRNMYRIYLNDAIYFRKNITANIEHGPVNNKYGQYHSICFYYWQNDTMYSLTDSLDIGNTSSETAHQYKIYGQNTVININSSFEGSFDKTFLQLDGRMIKDSVEFIAHIQANNVGVRLLRTFDYSYQNQTADVFVNDQFVGTWLNAGFNPIQQFRDDHFTIPSKFTQNETSLKIKIVVKNTWASLQYKIFTLLKENTSTATFDKHLNENSFLLYPNPSSEILNISSNHHRIKTVNIYQIDGKFVHSYTINGFTPSLNISQLSGGMYLAEIITDTNQRSTQKFVVE